jgi:hypothetical protein
MYVNGAWRIAGYGNTANGGAATTFDTADLAEWIPSTGEKPVAAEVLTAGDSPVTVKKSVSAYDQKLMGIVSTTPHTVMGAETPTSVQIALSGRVPVKISSENGGIMAGDYVTSSSTPGVAMKATHAGYVVGKALEDWNPGSGKTTVMVLVNVSYVDPGNQTATGSALLQNLSLDASGNLLLPSADPSAEVAALGGTPKAEVKHDLAWTLSDLVRRITKLESNTASGSATQSTASGSAQLSATDTARLDSLSSSVASLNTNVSDLQSSTGSNSAQISELKSQVASLSADLNLFASASASLNNTQTASTAAQLGLDKLDANNVTVSNTLSVLGRTTLGDTGITGKLNIGLLAINGLDSNCPLPAGEGQGEGSCATINTTSGPLKLQSDGFNGVDILGGKVVIAANGNITVKGEITAKKLNIDTSDVAGASLGTATLTRGQQTITVNTTALTPKSKIFVEPIDSPVATAVKATGSATFEIKVSAAQTSDLKLHWWIVN